MSYYVLNALDTVPASVTKAGTINILADKVKITGTNFYVELSHGDWIVDIANLEVRQVKQVHSDTEAELFAPFSNSSSITTRIVPKASAAVVYMELIAVGGDVTIDGVGILRNGVPYSDGQPSDGGNNTKFVAPKIVDAALTPVDVNITRFSNTIEPQL
jgi:hypothetical protein